MHTITFSKTISFLHTPAIPHRFLLIPHRFPGPARASTRVRPGSVWQLRGWRRAATAPELSWRQQPGPEPALRKSTQTPAHLLLFFATGGVGAAAEAPGTGVCTLGGGGMNQGKSLLNFSVCPWCNVNWFGGFLDFEVLVDYVLQITLFLMSCETCFSSNYFIMKHPFF